MHAPILRCAGLETEDSTAEVKRKKQAYLLRVNSSLDSPRTWLIARIYNTYKMS